MSRLRGVLEWLKAGDYKCVLSLMFTKIPAHSSVLSSSYVDMTALSTLLHLAIFHVNILMSI